MPAMIELKKILNANSRELHTNQRELNSRLFVCNSRRFAFNFLLFLSLIILSSSGCAQIAEPFKTIWGSSTRALNNARSEAITKTYKGSFNEAFKTVLEIAAIQKWEVFIKNRSKRVIVVMGIKGNVNTTEIGIFFDELKDGLIKIDVSSLSSTAKMKVAEAIFTELSKQFTEVQK